MSLLNRYSFISLCFSLLLWPGLAFSGVDEEQSAQEERDPIVWKISFEGNENYAGIVLREVIAAETPSFWQKLFRKYDEFMLNETELRRDRIRIMRYYERRGYSDVDVQFEINEGNKEWKKKVLFTISEGEPIRISNVDIEIDADSATREELRNSQSFVRNVERQEFAEGKIYQTIRRPDVEGRFLEVMENEGYPWPEVNIEANVDSLAKTTDVKVIATPGPKSYFTNFTLEGDLSVSENVVLRETGIKEGDVYDRRRLQDAQRQIFGHHLFRFASITLPEQPQDSTLDMRIRVRENPLRSVQASVGFGREELLRGQLTWQHRNISGNGHRLGITGRGSFIEQRFGVDYLVPYVFNTRSSFVASPFGERRLEPAFEIVRAGITNSLIYQIERNLTATASYEYTVNEELSRQEDADLPENMLEYNVSSLSFSGYFAEELSRDPRGWVIQPSAEFSGTFGEATYTFQKMFLDVRHYLSLTESTTLAGRINTGTIFYTQSEDLPSNIRFFSGGTNSVRGWSRQSLGPKRVVRDEDGNFDGFVPIGGRTLLNMNLEIRQEIPFLPGFGVATFLDGGQVWESLSNLDDRPLQFGAGGGIRYQSPIGPVRVDIAYKINPFDEDLDRFNGQDLGNEWSRIGIHFSIGQAF
ncbi:MAG: BamA/TamA family outer membrane protein [Balneolaceae bacterium]